MTGFGKILVPHDGSSASEKAVRYAVDLAGTSSGSQVVLMHVIPTMPLPFSSMNTKLKSNRKARSSLSDIYTEMENNAERILSEKKRELEIGARAGQNLEIKTHIVIS